MPAYEMVDSLLVQKWKDYVDRGGHLVVTCRTGVKDRFGHFWEDETAAPVAQLVGARITATDMLAAHHKGDILMNDRHYQWNDWADLLEPAAGTEVLAVYDNQFYKGNAAVVQRKIGKGTVWYIGVSTDDAKLETALLKKSIYESRGYYRKLSARPAGVLERWILHRGELFFRQLSGATTRQCYHYNRRIRN
ncbi:beta-galactosidase trimerization domain-containing protein [Niabella defluvii]|nr:beta-galactosidase trimerization domain-containing protein [Niabella sp. I65]